MSSEGEGEAVRSKPQIILHCFNSCQKLLGVYRQELSLADAKAFRFVLCEGATAEKSGGGQSVCQ